MSDIHDAPSQLIALFSAPYARGLIWIIAMPVAAIPIFFAMRLAIPHLRGSALTFALAIPSVLFPIRILVENPYPYYESSFVFMFLLFPQMLVVLAMALLASIQLVLVVGGRLRERSFSAPETTVSVIVVAAMYCWVIETYLSLRNW
jgi:hypothetical protein